MSYPRMRASRAMSPYFGDASTSIKAVSVLLKDDGRRRRQGQWVFSQAGTSRISKKRNKFFLDPRFRKHDHRGCVSVRDSSPPSPYKFDPRVQGDDSLFWRGVNVSKKRNQCCWILAYARMTIGGVSAFGTPLHRHPLSLTRGSRTIIPYFGDVIISPIPL